MDSPPTYLDEIHDFLDFSVLDPNLENDSYLISRASSSSHPVSEEIWEFEKGNNMGFSNLIATHSPVHQTTLYCPAKSSSFSPWAAPTDSRTVMTASKQEGQLLLKKCLLKMLPWMRDAKRSRQYIEAGVESDSHTVNYSNLNTSTSTSGQQDETGQQHMLAERNRRRKHKECLKVLQTLLPISSKMDKVSVLQCAIEHLKELQACKEDLEKHMEELERTNAVLQSFFASGSLSNRKLAEAGTGPMSINTDNPGSTSINSSGGMVLPSPDSTVSYLHSNDHCEHDIQHGTSISSRASVSINSSLRSDNTLSINALISAPLTSGSDQLVNVLICLKDLGLQPLTVKSRFERTIFVAEISAIANKDVICAESQIQDALVNTLLTTFSSN